MQKQNFLVTVSAMALVAAMTTAGMSQSPNAGSSGAQEQQKAIPDAKSGATPNRGAAEQPKEKGSTSQRDSASGPKGSDRAEEKASPKSQAQGREAKPKSSDRAQKSDNGSESRSRTAGEKGNEGTKQSEPGQAKDRDRSRADRAEDTRKRDDRAGRGENDSRRQSDGKSAKRDRAAGEGTDKGQGDRKGGDRAQSDSGSADRVQLSEQKRSSVRERMTKSARSNRVTEVNFDIRVGANVPRSATLHVLPADVVEIVPEYRGYRYVYVRDEIVIIHPTNYVVVAVIGGDSRVGSRSGSITLTADDRTFVRRSVDLGASVRLGIGGVSIGMDLPGDVELRPLPSVVVERYPDLRDHRYFVYESDVVIVEPQSREVVLVIED